jgi:hypothetical protein
MSFLGIAMARRLKEERAQKEQHNSQRATHGDDWEEEEF